MRYELSISRRLSLSTAIGDKRSLSPAVKVAVTAVALSVAVMLAALAIVGGFKREITQRLYGFNSHLTVYVIPSSEDENNTLLLSESLRKVLDDAPYITDYNLETSLPAIFKTRNDFKGIYLKGISEIDKSQLLKSSLIEGRMPKKENELLVAKKATDQLGLSVGDSIDTYFFGSSIKVRRLPIAGIFDTHFDAFDNIFTYAPIPLSQELSGMNAQEGTMLRIRTTATNPRELPLLADDLADRLATATASGYLSRNYGVDNAADSGASYFSWLQLLDQNVMLILILMSAVAAVTLISGLLITVLDKRRFIGLLRSLGASVSSVRLIFILLSLKIAAIGLIIGNALMLSLLYIQDKTHLLRLDPDAYYIDLVPVDINWMQVLELNIAVMVLLALVLIVPSRFASKLSPAEALR